MGGLTLRVDARGLKEIEREFARLRAQVPRAIEQGLNEGGDKTRTAVQRKLREQSSLVRYSSVTSRVRTMRAFGAGLSYQIIVSGKATKISEFRAKVRRGAGGGVSALMWGVWRQFERSFQIAGRAGFAGLRARLGKDRLPVRSFDGPNLAKEAMHGETPGVFYASAAEFVPAAVGKRIARILK